MKLKAFFKSKLDVPFNFSGKCFIINDQSIRFYKCGLYHRKNGPSIILKHEKHWHFNGKRYRKDGPAIEFSNGHKVWYYKSKAVIYEEPFTKQSWKRFIKLQMFK